MSPIKPERKKLYPPNWEKISRLVIEKAGHKCELCGVDNHSIRNGSFVFLTVHHINHDPTDNRRINLIALCQRCHLRLDLPFKHKKKLIGELFERRKR
jgi:5-methylcytosine-specific restriction endonuclease McrA